jgi:hypothetical protein
MDSFQLMDPENKGRSHVWQALYKKLAAQANQLMDPAEEWEVRMFQHVRSP